MLTTITLTNKEGIKWEASPAQAIQIQHDSHYSYSFAEYVKDLMLYFRMTKEEAEKEVKTFFKII